MEDAICLCLVALFTKGHVLLEGNPGLGKTALVKALSGSIRLRWGRIQFTPDLMPADITGTEIPHDGGVLKFKEGPVFVIEYKNSEIVLTFKLSLDLLWTGLKKGIALKSASFKNLMA
jgi:MoxR-like ATPase